MAIYVVSFLSEGAQDFRAFLRRMGQKNPSISVTWESVTVTAAAGGIGAFEILDGEDWALRSRGHVEEGALFTLFTAYFSTSERAEPGLLVTTETDGQVKQIAIAPGEESTPLGPLTVVVDPAEVLINMAVFQAAWPNLVIGDFGDADNLAETGEVVEHPAAEGLTIAALVQDPDIDRDSISFFIFGMAPRDVAAHMLRPETYILEDEGFVVINLEAIDNRIEVVSFQTDRGAVSELRVPLALDQVSAAIQRLAPLVPVDMAFGHVLDADDTFEVFSVQMLDRSGFGTEIINVKLQF